MRCVEPLVNIIRRRFKPLDLSNLDGRIISTKEPESGI
jgi:hypothetical protein